MQPLEKAIGWAAYLETHARRIYAVAVNPDLFAARALAQKILERAVPDDFARHQVYRHGWTYLTSPDVVQRAAGILVDLNWLREVTVKTSGAPKTTYRINPRIWETAQTPPEKTERSPADDAEPNAGEPGSTASNDGGGS
jgi:putative DNA primase/helicase